MFPDTVANMYSNAQDNAALIINDKCQRVQENIPRANKLARLLPPWEGVSPARM